MRTVFSDKKIHETALAVHPAQALEQRLEERPACVARQVSSTRRHLVKQPQCLDERDDVVCACGRIALEQPHVRGGRAHLLQCVLEARSQIWRGLVIHWDSWAVVIMKVDEAQAVRCWDLGTEKPDGRQQVVEAHRAPGLPAGRPPSLDLKLEFVWYEVVFAFLEASYAGGSASRERVEGFETGEVRALPQPRDECLEHWIVGAAREIVGGRRHGLPRAKHGVQRPRVVNGNAVRCPLAVGYRNDCR